jgi:AraC family ethanolamine operon transcriptional activator
MANRADVHNPPAVEINEIFDPAVASSALGFLDQDLVQLPSPTSLKARQVIVRLNGAVLVYYSTNVRVRTRPTLHKEFVAYIAFDPTSVGTANGLPVRWDALMTVPPTQTIAVVAEPGYQSVSFLIRPDDLGAHLSAQGKTEMPEVTRAEMLSIGSDLAGKLFEWGKRLVDAAIEQPELFNDSSARRAAAKQDMLETVLSTLATTSRIELERRERTRQMQSDIVRAAEQYALAHADDRVYVKDLCQAAVVSERSLEYAFRVEMGLSPTAYLTRIRLHKVRETLLQGASTPTTVTNEALRWGFWHFGEFAKAYKACFQELPSDTLRRARGD